jgi:hypothetical protein
VIGDYEIAVISAARFVCSDGTEFVFEASVDENGKLKMAALPHAPSMYRDDFERATHLEQIDVHGRVVRRSAIQRELERLI